MHLNFVWDAPDGNIRQPFQRSQIAAIVRSKHKIFLPLFWVFFFLYERFWLWVLTEPKIRSKCIGKSECSCFPTHSWHARKITLSNLMVFNFFLFNLLQSFFFLYRMTWRHLRNSDGVACPGTQRPANIHANVYVGRLTKLAPYPGCKHPVIPCLYAIRIQNRLIAHWDAKLSPDTTTNNNHDSKIVAAAVWM